MSTCSDCRTYRDGVERAPVLSRVFLLMRVALYQPDIPQNTGTILRTAACFGIGVDIIEPCGFVFSEPKMRRAGMDYLDHVDLVRHRSWEAFLRSREALGKAGRLVLLTTGGEVPLDRSGLGAGDTLLLGRETAGVPEAVHDSADLRVRIPMAEGMRSLNVAVAASMALWEGQRSLTMGG